MWIAYLSSPSYTAISIFYSLHILKNLEIGASGSYWMIPGTVDPDDDQFE